MPKEVYSKNQEPIKVTPPNFQYGHVWIKGTAPLVVHAWGRKAPQMMKDKMIAGSTAVKNIKKTARDFESDFNEARYRDAEESWDGFPADAIRKSCISACRLVGFKMTMAKLSLFVLADGIDTTSGRPLIKIIGDEPRRFESMVRLSTGVCNISIRPQWVEWGAHIRFRYDEDQFTATDVCNLIARAGMQVGICEGRPDSTNSAGMGFGTFEISTEKEVMALVKKTKKKGMKKKGRK